MLVAAQTIDIGPAPGRLIDVGGRKLHVNCAGSGSPIIILEAGVSSFAIDWSLVKLSSNARHTVVQGSGHEVHLFQPTVVTQAIGDVVRAARDKKPLAKP